MRYLLLLFVLLSGCQAALDTRPPQQQQQYAQPQYQQQQQLRFDPYTGQLLR